MAHDHSEAQPTELKTIHDGLVQEVEPHTYPSSDVQRHHSANEDNKHNDLESPTTSPPLPSTTLPLQSWNSPRANIPRFITAFYSFFIVGLSDSAYGALLPYFSEYYNLTYTTVSLVFLAPFLGYTLAATLNSRIHQLYGQRGIALLAPTCHTLSFVLMSLHPPWPCIVLLTCLSGFGTGLLDAAWSTWAGHMVAGNVLEGALHAFYALGCTFSPLIATSLVVRRGLEWYVYYYVLAGAAATGLVGLGWSFWRKNGEVYRLEHPKEEGTGGSTRRALRERVTWLGSVFFFLYIGLEVAVGGWIVSFMLQIRNATPYTSGIVATGFWAGMTVGRSFLGLVTHTLIEYTNNPARHTTIPRHLRNLTERSILTLYLLLAVLLQLLFWLLPSIVGSAVSVAFLGVMLGPVFPSGIILATKLLPGHLHVPSVGFATAIGGTGGAVFPFVVGVIAQKKGVWVLQPIVLAMLVVLLGVWLLFPRVKVARNEERDD